MKQYIAKSFAIAMIVLAFAGCGKDEEDDAQSVVGTWELVSIETRSADLDGTPVSVTLSFLEDGTFTMSQLVGEGRASSYSGTYLYDDGFLSGTYSNGKAWGDTYTVTFPDDSSMTLTTSDGKESDSYKKLQ